MQYFLGYTLGLKPNEENGWVTPKPQMKADKGNIVHKALELLARKKLAMQKGEPTFSEDEIGKTWDTASFTVDEAFEEGWHVYTKIRAKNWPWTHKEYKECKGWTYDAITMNNGMWNPLNRDVVMPEQFFDLKIERDWAKYNYMLPDGTKLQGHLAIKGTVDLVTRVSSDTLEYCDWKSGMRKDWATGKPKDWKKLRDDPQLRLYHYALTQLYPNEKYIVMTIVYIQDGGAFSLDFGPSDIPKTEAMLKERFELIRDCQRPSRISSDPVHKWKCARLCSFGMSNWEGGKKTVCDHFHGDLMSLGMDRVMKKYSDGSSFKQYGEGGGRSEHK